MNKTGKTVVKSSTKLSEVNVKYNFTSHTCIDKKTIFDMLIKLAERGNIDISSTQIHDRSFNFNKKKEEYEPKYNSI